MADKRMQERVFPRDFQDFKVHLRLADLTINGTLGNLSEEGMCAIVQGHAPSVAEALTTNRAISGMIEGPRLKHNLSVSGQVIWTDERELNAQPARFVGVKFDQPIELPEAVLALCMAETDV